MLGTLRLLLALAVALSHAGWRVAGLNPGVAAVVGFYLISGYVMAGLLRRHYCTPASAPAFYADRALRLLPQYLLYAGLTLAWATATRATTPFLQHAPTPGDLLNNALVVPLNYFMFNGSDRFTLIPPAWSLGAEVQFYLLAPFLLLSLRRCQAAGALSLGVFALALAGVLHSDWFGYRLLPGVLWFFVLGAVLQGLHARQAGGAALLLVAGVMAAALGLLWGMDASLLNRPYHHETLLGLLLFLPLLHALARRQRQGWDEMLGNLSYGVFLNHFPLMWVLFPTGVAGANAVPLLLACVALAWASHRWVERPVLAWRQRLRRPAGAPA